MTYSDFYGEAASNALSKAKSIRQDGVNYGPPADYYEEKAAGLLTLSNLALKRGK